MKMMSFEIVNFSFIGAWMRFVKFRVLYVSAATVSPPPTTAPTRPQSPATTGMFLNRIYARTQGVFKDLLFQCDLDCS